MFSLRRWWDRHGLPLLLTVAVFGLALILQQTQGGPLMELYGAIARPFQPKTVVDPTALWRNAEIVELQTRLANLEKQNRVLKDLLKYKEASQKNAMAVPVIGRSGDYWLQQITLGRGTQDGLKVGDVVLGVGGLVGRITQTSGHTSRVLLISDPQSRIGAMVVRNRQAGVIQGNQSQQVTLKLFEKVTDLKPGDLVITSNDSLFFPPDLPIGKVMSVDLTNGPTPEAQVELNVPLNYLEWVLVMPFQAPAAIAPPSPPPSSTP